ncbi:hypothetical protein [Nonomuraea pusilla]|uniref:hypothetical protein n=1 Tax=Nonomuraea pusilla TaxID=46177 RepID=UPI0011605302|nr:hypothetical protein [Nonomuraea pusilla]
MTLIASTQRKITSASKWYGTRVHARPVATLAISGVILASFSFLLGVSVSVAAGDASMPWARYVTMALTQVGICLGIGLYLRDRR